MSEDAELMVKVRGGDEAAFAALMDRWELPVKGFLLRMTRNAAEAEDLAQEAFVRVWQQRARFRPGVEFRPWLFAIAVNLARNRLRWWRRRPAVAFEEGMGNGGADAASGRSAVVRKERVEAVGSAVAALPRRLREALVLFEYEELSHTEIAAALSCTPKAVEARLYRARALLRESLKVWAGP